MKRKRVLIGVGGVMILTAVIIIIISVTINREPTEEALSFCESFPSAVFCTEESPDEIDIAADMMETFMMHYPNVMSDSFCTNYFYGNLRDYCLTNPSAMVPRDFNIVSREFELVRVADGIYDIRTKYSNNVPAYAIRLALNNMDGAYHISGFSFYDIPAAFNLALTEDAINDFMIDMIAKGDNPDAVFCETYFTWKAKSDCQEDPDDYIANPDVNQNFVVVDVATNRYEYTVSNGDESLTLVYEILFENVDGIIKISELQVHEYEETTE